MDGGLSPGCQERADGLLSLAQFGRFAWIERGNLSGGDLA